MMASYPPDERCDVYTQVYLHFFVSQVVNINTKYLVFFWGKSPSIVYFDRYGVKAVIYALAASTQVEERFASDNTAGYD